MTAVAALNELSSADPATRPLSEVGIGDRARVCRVEGPPHVRLRLLEMGLTSGTLVEVIRVAPLGDPMELSVRGYRLSVRRSEAAAVRVEAA